MATLKPKKATLAKKAAKKSAVKKITAKPKVNAAMMDLAMRQQVLLERFKGAALENLHYALEEIIWDLKDKLAGPELTALGRLRVGVLLQSVMQDAMSIMQANMNQQMLWQQELAELEVKNTTKAMKQILAENGVPHVGLVVPPVAKVWAAVESAPLLVNGLRGEPLLRSFTDAWPKGSAHLISNTLQVGFYEGLTNAEILAKVIGTAAHGYKDGVLNTARHTGEAVVRTAIQHTATVARQEALKQFDIFEEYQWVSTLDSRTSQTCRSLDGQKFPVGEGPMPPAHVNCRSSTVPVLPDKFAGLSEGRTRASKDGYVDADLSYYEWLKDESAEFQDLALGPSRAKLFRDGGLTADQFVKLNFNEQFEPMTLERMRNINPAAFTKAGVAVATAAPPVPEVVKAAAAAKPTLSVAQAGLKAAGTAPVETVPSWKDAPLPHQPFTPISGKEATEHNSKRTLTSRINKAFEASISYYTSNEFQSINSFLRGGDVRDLTTTQLKTIADLNDLMKTSVLEHDVVLYRGLWDTSWLHKLVRAAGGTDMRDLKQYVGVTFEDPAFLSFSTEDIGWGATLHGALSITFRLKRRKGQSGVNAMAVSRYHDEKEVILPAGRFRITEVDSDGYLVVEYIDE